MHALYFFITDTILYISCILPDLIFTLEKRLQKNNHFVY
jgi:hypothetical protein